MSRALSAGLGAGAHRLVSKGGSRAPKRLLIELLLPMDWLLPRSSSPPDAAAADAAGLFVSVDVAAVAGCAPSIPAGEDGTGSLQAAVASAAAAVAELVWLCALSMRAARAWPAGRMDGRAARSSCRCSIALGLVQPMRRCSTGTNRGEKAQGHMNTFVTYACPHVCLGAGGGVCQWGWAQPMRRCSRK